MILIFDYFETLLTSKRVDFNQGLKVFWERYYKDRCQFEEIKAYGEELFLQLLSMHAEGKEYPFVEAELPLYAQRFGGDDLQNIVSYNVSSISELADLLNIK